MEMLTNEMELLVESVTRLNVFTDAGGLGAGVYCGKQSSHRGRWTYSLKTMRKLHNGVL